MSKFNVYKEIISSKNIEAAYFNTLSKFEAQQKTNSYKGLDGLSFVNSYINLLDLIDKIQKEMVHLNPVNPAIKILIPKQNKPGDRTIFIHTIKERIKSQAIYQVIYPIIEKELSNFLFSYRSSHPHYKAAQGVARRYRKKYTSDYVLIGDISDYCDNINKEILKNKFIEIGFDNETIKLINLFIDNEYFEKGTKQKLSKGLVHGEPLISIFYNLYINDIDKFVGKKVSLYRRVGDDFILLDSNLKKIKGMRDYIVEALEKNEIPGDKQKIKIHKLSENFKFLGYDFNNGLISISKPSVQKIKKRWRNLLRFYSTKKTLRERIFFQKSKQANYEFLEIIKHYSQINNYNQIKNLSDYFFIRLTIYLFGQYNDKNRRKTEKKFRDNGYFSLYDVFLRVKSGKSHEIKKIMKTK